MKFNYYYYYSFHILSNSLFTYHTLNKPQTNKFTKILGVIFVYLWFI